MSTEDVAYIQCFGCERLVLQSAAEAPPPERKPKKRETQKHTPRLRRVSRQTVLEGCTDEIRERGEPIPTCSELEETLAQLTRVGWLRKYRDQVSVTETGWGALGWDRAGEPGLPERTDRPARLAATLGTIWQIVAEVADSNQGIAAKFRHDPRVNPNGQVTQQDLRIWASWLGVVGESFDRAVACAVQKGLLAVVSTCALSTLDLLSATARGSAAFAGFQEAEDFRSQSGSNRKALKEAIEVFLMGTEQGLDERVRFLPNVKTRSEATAWNEKLGWPSSGAPLDQIENHLQRVFPGVALGNLLPSCDGVWTHLKPIGIVPFARMWDAQITDSDIAHPFLDRVGSNSALNGIAGAILELLKEGQIEITNWQTASAGDLLTTGPVFRLSPKRLAVLSGSGTYEPARLDVVAESKDAPGRRSVAAREAIKGEAEPHITVSETAMRILKCLADSRDKMLVKSIAYNVKRHRNTVRKHLNLLRDHGFVQSPDDGSEGVEITSVGREFYGAKPTDAKS